MPVGQTTKALLAQARAAGKPLYRVERDSQQSRLYKAEQVIRRGKPQLSPRDAQALVNRIRTSAYVLKHYGDPGEVHVIVSKQRTRKSAADVYGGRLLLAATWGLSADVIVHEMAHMYASPAGDPGHGWLFCHIYLDFVRKFMGADQAALLKASFKANKIKFAPPRARKALSPEQKAAAVERMAKARAARGLVSTGEWVVIAYRQTWNRWYYVKGVRNYNISLTSSSNYAMVRKTDASAHKMLTAAKRSTWSDTELLLVNRLDVPTLRDFDPQSLVKR